MSFSTSLQLLLATGSTRPWRQNSDPTMPTSSSFASSPSKQSQQSDDDGLPTNGAIARRYGSSPILIHQSYQNGSSHHNHTASYSAPPSRRSSPAAHPRSVLSSLSSHISSRLTGTRSLLIMLCTVHTVVVVCVLLWLFSTSSPSTSSTLTSSASDVSSFGTWDALLSKMDLNKLHYSSPVSIRPLTSSDDRQQLVQSLNHPAAHTDAQRTIASGNETVDTPAETNLPDQFNTPPADSTQSANDKLTWTPPAAALGVPLAAFFNQLQHEQCTDSFASPPTNSKPVRSLIYSCSANAIRLEHADELYEQHSIAGLYALLRAATLATASNRTLLLDDSHCDTVRSLPAGTTKDAGLLCCEWRSLFQPLSSCAMPDDAASALPSSNVHAWSSAAVVQYDAAQECMWDEETWTAMTALFPDIPIHSAVRSLATQLFRPSKQLASTVSLLSSALPASALILHIPPFSIQSDRDSNYTFASAIPGRIYANTARMHALTIGQSSLALLATFEELQYVQQSLPHLSVFDVWSLAAQSVSDVPESMRWAAIQASVVLWGASRSEWWIGVHQSLLTQLVVALEGNVSVLDVSGDRWMSSCWSASAHTLSAELALPRAYNLPAIASLTSGHNTSATRTPLVLVLGSAGVGVPLLNTVLADSDIGFTANNALSHSYSELFKARDYTVPAYAENRINFIETLRTAAATPNSRGILLCFERDEKAGRERALTHYHHTSFLAQIVNNYQLPFSVHVLVVVREPTSTLRGLLTDALPPTAANLQTRVLFESRLLRDVIYGVEAETAAMDVSVYRVFNHERLWRKDTAKEAGRMAAFLQLPSDVQQRFVEKLSTVAKSNEAGNFPLVPLVWLPQEDTAQLDTYTSMSALQLYNHNHPAHRTSTHDYHRSFAAALVAVKQPSALSSFSEWLSCEAAGRVHRSAAAV